MQHPSGSRHGRELRSGQAPEENSGAEVQTNENAGRMPALQNGGRQSAPYKRKTPRRGSRGALSYKQHYTPKRGFVK